MIRPLASWTATQRLAGVSYWSYSMPLACGTSQRAANGIAILFAIEHFKQRSGRGFCVGTHVAQRDGGQVAARRGQRRRRPEPGLRVEDVDHAGFFICWLFGMGNTNRVTYIRSTLLLIAIFLAIAFGAPALGISLEKFGF